MIFQTPQNASDGLSAPLVLLRIPADLADLMEKQVQVSWPGTQEKTSTHRRRVRSIGGMAFGWVAPGTEPVSDDWYLVAVGVGWLLVPFIF